MNIKIFGQLFFERDQNDPLLDHIIICIYGLLKKHIATLISTNIKQQNIYNDIKALILECLKKRYLNLGNPTYIMRNYICDCLSILIISGITCSWQTCIQDLINEAKSGNNPELIFIALRSIADCSIIMNFYGKETDDEYWDDNLNIQNKQKNEIKNKLMENSDLILTFIDAVYSNINKLEKLKNRIIKAIIDLIAFWTQLNLNILTNNKVYITVMNLINMTEDENDKFENLKSVAELINTSITASKNCKLYEFYERINENYTPSEVLETIHNNIDINEKNGIDNCLNYLLKKIEEYINAQNQNENILWIYAKILSCFLENYIFFFFDFNNKANEIIFNLLKFFISHKKRKISWMFFNTMDSMMNYICEYYKFNGLDENQKQQFINYLINILLNVMENCAYKKLNPNDFSQLQNSILFQDIESNWETKNDNDFYNNTTGDEFDLDDIDLKEYRNCAEHVFCCIYIIFKEGLNLDYAKYFINKITSLINLNDDNIKNNYDEKNAIILDVILLVIKSIIKEINIDSSLEIVTLINNYIYNLSDSVYIQNININIFIDYLLIINKFGNSLLIDQKYFEKAILKLLSISNIKDINQCLIDSCYKVISNLCGDLKENINFENIFKVFLERFKNIYKLYNIKNLSPLIDLINAMFYVMGINRMNDNDNENDNENTKYKGNNNLVPFINKIFEPVNNDLDLLLEEKNNINNVYLKAGIIKSFILYKYITYNIHYCDSSLKKIIYNNFIPKNINNLITIFKNFPNDTDIFSPINDFYANNANYIGEHCLASFSTINNVFMQLFKSNVIYFEIIYFFTIIYRQILENLNKNDNNYLEQNKYMLDYFFILTEYSIKYIKEQSTFDGEFINKIKLFVDLINEVFPLLYIVPGQSDYVKNIIQNIILIFGFIIEIINLIIKEDKNNKNEHLVNDNIISFIIQSIAALFNENIIKCLLLNLPNDRIGELIRQIVDNSWNLFNLKNFKHLSSQELSGLYWLMILFNCKSFCEIFLKCLEKKIAFPDNNYFINISDYISIFCNNKDKIRGFIKEIVSIAFEGKNPDCLEYYFNQLKRKKNNV